MKTMYSYNMIPENMERVQKIIHHPEFEKAMDIIGTLEKKRKFCGHDIKHLLDVARIAYIENLEESLGYSKDVIYGVGLLHDIGKYLQYIDGTGHHITSEKIARHVLQDAGYESIEIEDICQAILNHRNLEDAEKTVLGRTLYRADKLSRACYACSVSDKCDWSQEKKTPGVIA